MTVISLLLPPARPRARCHPSLFRQHNRIIFTAPTATAPHSVTWLAWEIPVGSASQGRRCSNDKTNNYYATICASEQEHSPCKGPRVLKRGPRHQVLIAVQAPWNRAEQHMAPAATAPRAASAAGARRRNRQGMRPSFPLGVEISSSSSVRVPASQPAEGARAFVHQGAIV